MKLASAALIALSVSFAAPAFAQGTDQTSSNRSVGAADRAGAQSTQPGPGGQTREGVTTPSSTNNPQGTFAQPESGAR